MPMQVEQLSKLYAVRIDEDNREAAEAIRRLINSITVTRTQAGTDIRIDGLLGLPVDHGQFSSSSSTIFGSGGPIWTITPP